MPSDLVNAMLALYMDESSQHFLNLKSEILKYTFEERYWVFNNAFIANGWQVSVNKCTI